MMMNMDDHLLLIVAILLLVIPWRPVAADPGEPTSDRHLRVCADPNNLPFSNQHLECFENRLAELIARELHATVQYTWWA
jgi:mxaJ protein